MLSIRQTTSRSAPSQTERTEVAALTQAVLPAGDYWISSARRTSPNIHLDTEEFRTLRISTDKDYLKGANKNLLYTYHVAFGELNLEEQEPC